MTALRVPLLALLLAPFLYAVAPFYSADSIVNAATGIPGEFAPNSIVTIYGTDLAYGTEAAAPGARDLPQKLAGVSIYLAGFAVNLFYVSPKQINFLVPANLLKGTKSLYIFREGIVGPTVTIVLKETAPGLFSNTDGVVTATHADGRVITPDSPAVPEEVIVLYATGLGRTDPETLAGQSSRSAAPIILLNQLAVLLGGSILDSQRVLYAGITPGFAGLYQINLRVPVTSLGSPEIRVFIGADGSPSYLKLPMRLQ